MTYYETKDAGFFGMIHELVEQQLQGTKEQRSEARHAYECIQLVAPKNGLDLPSAADFSQVYCHDLSPKGFSFYYPRRPDFKKLIIALGKVPFSFFSAEVVRCSRVEDSQDEEYLVGCRFVGRLTDQQDPA